MKLKSMFNKDIERSIKGVIKVGQQDQENVHQELEEYVVTGEISKHLSKFYNNYQKGIDGTTDKMGVWISGFFGSGKSHFLKILSYILENRQLGEQKATDFFEDKIADSILFSDVKRLSSVPTEVILFNIDSKGLSDGKAKDDAILKVFKKVFNEHRGFYDGHFGIADMESKLQEEGCLDAFKREFKHIKGDSWEDRRRSFRFDGDAVVKALVAATKMTEESARDWHRNCINEYNLSIDEFSKEVKRYIDSKPKNFHLVFLVDEVGQYIGDDTKLMVNLQTMAEDLGTACKGKVWVMVTSQESIDEVSKNIKGDDFSKIQGRFDTRLSLSSISANEVIKKRILEKTDVAESKLKEIYREKSAILNNLIAFKDASSDFGSYSNEDDFALVYPFLPYQFKLLQNVFEQVRKHGSAGKHLSEGERSLLSAYKESAYAVRDEEEGVLIPFYAFYDTISEFLNPSITRVIEGAKQNVVIKKDIFNVEVLKVLFMLKYVKEMPTNLENIASLMVTHMDEDKLALREKIKKALSVLISETLVQKNGEEYIFLTDDEQDINREIKDTKIDEELVKKNLREIIFDDLYSNRRFRYSANYDFDFNKKMDEKNHGNQTASIGLNILSPLSEQYDKDIQLVNTINSGSGDAIVRLSSDSDYIGELEEAIRIDEYVKTKNRMNLSENILTIIDGKSAEARDRRKRVRAFVEEAVKNADIYINAQKQNATGSSVKEKLDNVLKLQVESAYFKLSYIESFCKNASDIDHILKSKQVAAIDMGQNKLAVKEVLEHIDLEESMNKQIRVKLLMDKFQYVPYGWNELDIAAVIAMLVKDQKIRLRYKGNNLDEKVSNVGAVLVKASENDSILVEKRTKVDAELLRQIKIICRDIWAKSDVPSEEDGIAKFIHEEIQNDKLVIAEYRAKYQGKKYPGESLLDKGLEYFNEFDNLRDNSEVFNKLIALKEDISLWREDMQLVANFFAKQKGIYDNGLDAYELYADNKFYLGDTTLPDVFVRLSGIIQNPFPYKEIKDIPELANEIISKIKQVAEDTRKDLSKRIESEKGYLTDLASGNGEAEKLLGDLNIEFANLFERANEDDSITRIDGLKHQCELIRNRFEERISLILHGKEKLEDGENPPGLFNDRVVKKIRYRDLFTIEKVKTAAEVDKLTKEMAKQLKLTLKNNDIEFID